VSATSEAGAANAAQRRAIEQSGWGNTFRLWQPHNAAFWLGALVVVAGALTLAGLYAGLPAVYAPSAIGGVVVWALYCVPWFLFLRHKDRYEREPARLAGIGFVWGGLAATFGLAFPGNNALISLYGKLISPAWAASWGPAFSAPIIEESAKAAGIVLLIVMAPQLVRSAYDGLILGAFVGLGFQVVENWWYTVQGSAADLGENQTASVLQTVISRGIMTGLFTHALYSAVFGMGLVWLIGRPPGEPRRVGRGLAFILFAVLAHGMWDGAAVNGGGAPLLLVVALAEIVVIVVGERWAATRERAWMRDLMAPEVDRGTITPPELDALAGSYRDRRRFIKAARGHRSHHQARHVIHAAIDLAEEIARADGHDTPPVDFARQEVLRVRGAQR
jgi:RsiW-degrading membrane proteinase PrsW (M82 family)